MSVLSTIEKKAYWIGSAGCSADGSITLGQLDVECIVLIIHNVVSDVVYVT